MNDNSVNDNSVNDNCFNEISVNDNSVNDKSFHVNDNVKGNDFVVDKEGLDNAPFFRMKSH